MVHLISFVNKMQLFLDKNANFSWKLWNQLWSIKTVVENRCITQKSINVRGEDSPNLAYINKNLAE